MADVSLDDYIKNDFRSKERRGNVRRPPLTSASKLASRGRPLITKNPARRSDQKLPVKQRINIGSRSVPNRNQPSFLPKRNTKIVSRKPELNPFDARLKLSTKSFKDAREKIGSNVVDARHKIQKSQAKKYEQDARKRIGLKRGLNHNGSHPKITVTGLGKQHSFRDSSSLGMTSSSGANIIRTVNNRDHQSRLGSTGDVTVRLKRTLTNDSMPSDAGGRLLGSSSIGTSSNNPLGMNAMSASYTVHNDKFQIVKNISSKTDDRSNIATYEPLRGPVIQLKNDHYREKPPLSKSLDYDYDNTPNYVPSPIRHLTSSSSPSSSSPWLSRLSSHPHTPSSVTRKDKYEMSSSSTNKPLSLDRGTALKLPRPSRDLIVGMAPSASKRIKPASTAESHGQFSSSSDVLSNSSTVSGYRVLVTNLHPIVTQDDIIELFGAVGALKKAHLLKPGCAEVVYISFNDAVAAVNKYHNRELDGQPMIVKQTTPLPTVSSSSLHSSSTSSNIPKSLGEPLKFRKDVSSSSTGSKAEGSSSRGGGGAVSQASSSTSSSVVDVNLIHKALFSHKNSGSTSTSSGTSSRPVTFTVKI